MTVSTPVTLFVDGSPVAAKSGEIREIRCPADRSVDGVVSEAGAEDVECAIAAARSAFDAGGWSYDPSAHERGDVLLRAAAALRDRKEDIARAESLDTGKRLVESRIDVDDVVACFTYFGKLAGLDAGRLVDAGDPSIVSRVGYEPVGVCALITPWNYPLLQASWKVAPALAAGNTFVLKPSELTPHTSIQLMQVLADVGIPAGVANLVLGAGPVVGARLAEHPDVDLVSFTGGVETGRAIAAAAAATVKRVTLELGGKKPNIVFADAHLDTALDNALTAAFLHSGQVCSAGARLLVEESIHDSFVDELVGRAQRIRLGGPFDDHAETGPLISAAHRDKVTEYVRRGVDEGALLRCGGRWGADHLIAGYYYEPTVLDRARSGMSAVRDEASDRSSPSRPSRPRMRRSGSGTTPGTGSPPACGPGDAGTAQRVAARLRHGTVWINDFHRSLPQAEWGGFGQSGIGRELGPTGLAEYREAKHVYHNLNPRRTDWFAGGTT